MENTSTVSTTMEYTSMESTQSGESIKPEEISATTVTASSLHATGNMPMTMIVGMLILDSILQQTMGF